MVFSPQDPYAGGSPPVWAAGTTDIPCNWNPNDGLTTVGKGKGEQGAFTAPLRTKPKKKNNKSSKTLTTLLVAYLGLI